MPAKKPAADKTTPRATKPVTTRAPRSARKQAGSGAMPSIPAPMPKGLSEKITQFAESPVLFQTLLLPHNLGVIRLYRPEHLTQINAVDQLPQIYFQRVSTQNFGLVWFGLSLIKGDNWPETAGADLIKVLTNLVEDALAGYKALDEIDSAIRECKFTSRENGYVGLSAEIARLIQDSVGVSYIDPTARQGHLAFGTRCGKPYLDISAELGSGLGLRNCYYPHVGEVALKVIITLHGADIVAYVTLDAPIKVSQLNPNEVCAFVAERLATLLQLLNAPSISVKVAE